jgi:hypothetical protein
MIKPVKAVDKRKGQDLDDELVKKQRKLLVNTLVKDFYPYKFSAAQIIKQKGEAETRDN